MTPAQRGIAAILIVSAVIGCRSGGPGRYDGLATEVSEQRADWRALGLTEYSFVLRRLCFCVDGGEPYRVHVRGDSLISVRHTQTGEPPQDQFLDLFPSIEGLFLTIEDAIARDAASIEVTFHPQQHYPQSIAIDYETMVIDEELGFAASDLTAGPPD
jgi:Family of unknown function (DUF6174)